MATLVDNFDSYTDGYLTGQGGWSGGDRYHVQGSVVQGGAKAISNTEDSTNVRIQKSIDQTAEGSQICYMRKTNTTDNNHVIYILGFEGTTMKWTVNFEGNHIVLSSGATIGSSLSPDTWYKVEIQWKASDDTIRGRIDDGTFSDWGAAMSAFSYIDIIKLAISNNNTGQTGYWDTMSDPNAVSGPAKLKTFNGLATAKIKTINGLAIAKVKTINNLP